MPKRPPFKSFHERYCQGSYSAEGYWKADGENRPEELAKRLDLLKISHPQEVVWKDVPPKQRSVIRIDVDGADAADDQFRGDGHLYKQLERTLRLKPKLDAVVENVMTDLSAGAKTIVWVLSRESVEIVTAALEKATDKKSVRTLMRQRNVNIWATHGEADIKARFKLCADYVEHKGAGVIIATMDSLPASVSLFGATTEHYAQLHYLPGPMEQTEDRPYLKGISKLHIFYYIAKGTVDERVEQLLFKRLFAAKNINKSADSAQLQAVLRKKEESVRDQWERLFGKMPDDLDDAREEDAGAEEVPEGE